MVDLVGKGGDIGRGVPEWVTSRNLTKGAQKPSITLEQVTSSYSFRSSELSQPI